MTGNKLNSSSGYFNREMLQILAKGEKKATPAVKKTADKKPESKNKPAAKNVRG